MRISDGIQIKKKKKNQLILPYFFQDFNVAGVLFKHCMLFRGMNFTVFILL